MNLGLGPKKSVGKNGQRYKQYHARGGHEAHGGGKITLRFYGCWPRNVLHLGSSVAEKLENTLHVVEKMGQKNASRRSKGEYRERPAKVKAGSGERYEFFREV